MHIPDGFLDARTCLATGAVSATAVGWAVSRVQPAFDSGLTARMGMTAAYVFAAQMINFPVAGGTSGHLLGGLLAAVLLGPHPGALVMTAVFLIQTFFFLDGGHTALGANVLNMGLVGTYGGYALYRVVAGKNPGAGRCLMAAGVAAWCSVMLGAALTSAQLAASGTMSAGRVFPAMLSIHALIGLGEGMLTVAALGLLWRIHPEWAGRRAATPVAGAWGWLAAGLLMLAVLAPLASAWPDGLEKVAESLGFADTARDPALPGPMPDYTLPGLEASWAPAMVSLLGAGLMFGTVGSLAGGLRLAGGPLGRALPPPPSLRAQLLSCLAVVVTAVLLPPSRAGALWILLALAGAWAIVGGVRGPWLARRLVLLVPFIALLVLSAVPGAGEGSLSQATLVLLRAGISLLATAAVVAGASEAEIIRGLRSLGLPRVLAETMGFGVRYFAVLREEAGRMLDARALRSPNLPPPGRRIALAGALIGNLYLRSYVRSQRVAEALTLRGYRGDLPPHQPWRWGDILFAGGTALVLAGVWWWH